MSFLSQSPPRPASQHTHSPLTRHAEEWEKQNLRFWRSLLVYENLPEEPDEMAFRYVRWSEPSPKPKEEPTIQAIAIEGDFYDPEDGVPVWIM